MAGQPWEADWTPTASHFGLSLGSESPRWEAVLGLPRPLTTKSCDLSESLRVGGRGRSNSASHAPQLDSTMRSNAFSREISQTATEDQTPSPGVCERPIGLRARQCKFVDFQCISGRPWEAVGGCAPLIGSDRSHDKLWEAEAMGGHGRPKVGGRGRPCSPDWLSDLSKPIRGARPPTASHEIH